MANPFASRKFVYAVSSIIMVLVVTYLPIVTAEIGLTLSADSIDALNSLLPMVVVIGLFVIGGHSVSDAISLWSGYQANPKLRENIEAILDELFGDDDDTEAVPLGEARTTVK